MSVEALQAGCGVSPAAYLVEMADLFGVPFREDVAILGIPIFILTHTSSVLETTLCGAQNRTAPDRSRKPSIGTTKVPRASSLSCAHAMTTAGSRNPQPLANKSAVCGTGNSSTATCRRTKASGTWPEVKQPDNAEVHFAKGC